MRFVVSQNWFSRQWRWKLVAVNGRSIAVSGESYRHKNDCLAAIRLVREDGPGSVVSYA